MAKILVTLEVPSLEKHYDMQVPDFLAVRDLVPLIAKAVRELSEKRYVSSGTELLCLREQGTILMADRTLENYHVKNGDHLMLY